MKNDPDKIQLRKLQPDDRLILSELANDIHISDNVRDIFPHPYSVRNAVEFIELCRKENPSLTFAIEYNSQLAGLIGLIRQTDIYRHSAEIGYWIGAPFRNKGIATAAVKRMLDYGFNSLQLQRIYSGVFGSNVASQRVLEKCGFKFEGVGKKAVCKNNRFIDEYRYGITR